MFRRLNRLLAAAAMTGVVLVLPPAALADCGGNASAVNVYTECLSSGGGGKHTTGGGGEQTSGSHSTSGTHTSGGSTGSTAISKQAAKALKNAGTDGRSLENLVNASGGARLLQSSSSGSAAEPTAVGSAFDLGSGPTALLIVLAGTAVLLLAASGMRVRRNRHRA